MPVFQVVLDVVKIQNGTKTYDVEASSLEQAQIAAVKRLAVDLNANSVVLPNEDVQTKVLSVQDNSPGYTPFAVTKSESSAPTVDLKGYTPFVSKVPDENKSWSLWDEPIGEEASDDPWDNSDVNDWWGNTAPAAPEKKELANGYIPFTGAPLAQSVATSTTSGKRPVAYVEKLVNGYVPMRQFCIPRDN